MDVLHAGVNVRRLHGNATHAIQPSQPDVWLGSIAKMRKITRREPHTIAFDCIRLHNIHTYGGTDARQCIRRVCVVCVC